eukprot:Opistho-1_new@31892
MRVVDVHKQSLQAAGYPSFAAWAAAGPLHVYIGRSLEHYVPGTKASVFQNPFHVKKYGREGCLREYERHLRSRQDLLAALDALPENAVLGCWCHPEPCHGDVLVRVRAERAAQRAREAHAAQSIIGSDPSVSATKEAPPQAPPTAPPPWPTPSPPLAQAPAKPAAPSYASAAAKASRATGTRKSTS